MKLKFLFMLLVFLLAVTTACSNDKSNSSSTPASMSIALKTPSDSKIESALEKYKAVLQNKDNFFDTDIKENVSLDKFLNNEDYPCKLMDFTVVDMDGDKTPEVVLEIAFVDINDSFFEILHYMNGLVYGYYRSIKELEGLKMDGTFLYRYGADDSGYAKMRFESNASETIIKLGYREPNPNQNDAAWIAFINNKPVSQEEYNLFCDKQDEKEDVVWFEFSPPNIEMELSIRL